MKYQQPVAAAPATASKELLTVKLRYKQPQAETSELLSFPVSGPEKPLTEATVDFRFAAAVACWGMLLRNSEHKGQGNFDQVLALARSARGDDANGYCAEFIQLVETAKEVERR